MKFLVEVFTLIVLFGLFREGVRRFMPKKQVMDTLSEDSMKALQRFRMRYFALLIGFTVVATIALQFLLGQLRSWWLLTLGDEYSFVFPLKQFSLWYPSLLLGFLISTLIAFRLNRTLQRDGLSFFLEEIQEEAQGYRSFGPKRWIQYGLGLILFVLLIIPQFRASVRGGEQGIEYHHGWSIKDVYEIQELDSLGSEQGHPVLYFQDSLKIDLDDYNYKEEDLKSYLKTKKELN